jgi:hypothetical protein
MLGSQENHGRIAFGRFIRAVLDFIHAAEYCNSSHVVVHEACGEFMQNNNNVRPLSQTAKLKLM